MVFSEVIGSRHHQPPGICACGQHTVNFIRLVGLSGSVKQLKGLIIISKGLEEKLEVFSLGAWGGGVAVVYI